MSLSGNRVSNWRCLWMSNFRPTDGGVHRQESTGAVVRVSSTVCRRHWTRRGGTSRTRLRIGRVALQGPARLICPVDIDLPLSASVGVETCRVSAACQSHSQSHLEIQKMGIWGLRIKRKSSGLMLPFQGNTALWFAGWKREYVL